MADFSKMFSAQVTKEVKPLSNLDIMDYRIDLSEKVKEHIDLIEKIVHNGSNPLIEIQQQLNDLSNRVISEADTVTGKWSKFFKSEPTANFASDLKNEFASIEKKLKAVKRPDPFSIQAANRAVDQAQYLLDQLVKVSAELEKLKAKTSDEMQVDLYNRRIATLYKQQQLVSIGLSEVKQLAMDIQTYPQQIDDLLNATLPTLRLLCMDVLSGVKRSDELRKIK